MRVDRFVPIVGWARSYKRSDLRFDVIAGITVSALVVPKALGYAGIAQVPLENGLYAAAAGAIVYAIFCTSRQISTGPSSALATVAGGAVVITAVAPGKPTAELVAAVTIAAGALFLVGALLRMGWISNFLSKAVITGFLFGAAIDVVIGELPKISGTEADGSNSWQEFRHWIDGLAEFHTTTFVVGIISLVVILTLHLTVPKIPGALVLVVGGIIASHLFDLEEHGVAVVGKVPRGLPSPDLPSYDVFHDHISVIAIGAVALFLIGFSQTAGDARTFASRHSYRIDVNQEMVAQGMANASAGVFQGMPVSTSLSASSLSDTSGARTPMTSMVTGVVVLLTLVLLAPVFSDLPKPVLAALIIDAVVFGMIDIPEMRRMWRVKRFDFWIAVLAIIGVLSAGVLAGVVIGMVLSVGWLVYVNALPAVTDLGRRPGTSAFRSLDEYPEGETYPGLLLVRFERGLIFVTADRLEEEIRQRVLDADPPVTGVVIDFAGVTSIDSQGAGEVRKLAELGDHEGFSLRLARVRSDVKEILRLDGVVERLGADRFHDNVDEAVAAELREGSARS